MQKLSVLAVDTSTEMCSVALKTCDGQVYHQHEHLPQKHAKYVLKMIDEVLEEAAVEGKEVDILIYGKGPGAFTGVRIASGVIQGLALGWNKPVLGISSLELMAEVALSCSQLTEFLQVSLQEEVRWCALMDARMQEVYMQTGVWNIKHNTWSALEPCLCSPKEAEIAIINLSQECKRLIGMGDIREVYPTLSQLVDPWFDAFPLAEAALSVFQRYHLNGMVTYEDKAEPLYLRNHVADTVLESAKRKRNLSLV